MDMSPLPHKTPFAAKAEVDFKTPSTDTQSMDTPMSLNTPSALPTPLLDSPSEALKDGPFE